MNKKMAVVLIYQQVTLKAEINNKQNRNSSMQRTLWVARWEGVENG